MKPLAGRSRRTASSQEFQASIERKNCQKPISTLDPLNISAISLFP
jgi:hypothetical protein